jgi:hypothetical protein
MTIQIVLDVNGVLVKRKWTGGEKQLSPDDNVIPMPTKRGCQHIRIRPHAVELIKAITETPDVILIFWSSMTREYMAPIVDLLLLKAGVDAGDVCIMTQEDCTSSPHPEVSYKPLFSKDVTKVYKRFPNSDGVVFIDDSMLKMGYNKDEVVRIVSEWDGVDKDDDTLSGLIENLTEIIKEAL